MGAEHLRDAFGGVLHHPNERPYRGRMVRVSTRSQVPPFYAMAMGTLAEARQAQGHRVLHLEVGQPSGGAPAGARAAAAEALTRRALGYTTSPGLPELRARIARHYDEWNGVRVDPRQVSVVGGASGGFVLAFLACFDVGSRVGLTEPGYPAYRNTLDALGCVAVGIPIGPETGYRLTGSAIESAHRAAPLDGLIIASPSNPTGTQLSDDDLAGLVSTCHRLGITLIADEIYHGITYGAPASTVLSHTDDVVVLNSFSKYFGMTGWRLGWIVAPPELVEPIDRLAQNLYICAPHVSQIAGLAAFDCSDELDARVVEFAEKRRVLLDGLHRAGLTDTAPSDGAFYAYADVSHLTDDSWGLCRQWLTDIDVAVTPGIDFDPVRGNRFVRFSYAGSLDDVREAAERIATWTATH